MRIIKQIIEKEMELYEEFRLKRFHKKAIWKFYCALNISLSFLKVKLSNKIINSRNIQIRKILVMKEINEDKFREVEKMINEDSVYIVQALEILDNVQNENYQKGDIYVPGMIAVSSYEFNT